MTRYMIHVELLPLPQILDVFRIDDIVPQLVGKFNKEQISELAEAMDTVICKYTHSAISMQCSINKVCRFNRSRVRKPLNIAFPIKV